MNVGDIVPAVVTAVNREAMQVRFGPYAARVVPKGLRVLPSGQTEGFRGIGGTAADQLVTPGDLIEVKITALETTDTDGNELENPIVEAELEQEPRAEAAIVAIENRTGRILAMVGGYSFNRSKFNRRDSGLSPARVALQGRAVCGRHRPGIHDHVDRPG